MNEEELKQQQQPETELQNENSTQVEVKSPDEKPTDEITQLQSNQKVEDGLPESNPSDVDKGQGVINPTEEKTPLKTESELPDEIKQKLDKLKEYEVNNKEVEALRQSLGVPNDEDPQIFSAKQQLAIIENLVQQDYIKLCNSYGVDFRPEKIEESAELLKQKDPQAYYDLNYKLNQLNDTIVAKRNEVETFIRNRDIGIALTRNANIMNASPAINKIINEFISQGRVSGKDIDYIARCGTEIAKEAIEIGRQLAMQEFEAKQNPSQVLNSNSIVQQAQSSTVQPEFTLADVAKMSLAEYEKNRALIDRLNAEGRLK